MKKATKTALCIVSMFNLFGCLEPTDPYTSYEGDPCRDFTTESSCLANDCMPVRGFKEDSMCLVSEFVVCKSDDNCLNLLVPTRSLDKTCWLINDGCFPQDWPSSSDERIDECSYLESLQACASAPRP